MMTRDEIKAGVMQVAINIFGENAAARLEGNPQPFKSHGDVTRLTSDLDSLDHLEFVMALEDHFDVEIDDTTGALIKTLDDSIATIETRLTRPLHGDR
jgi:acyl carrier protein